MNIIDELKKDSEIKTKSKNRMAFLALKNDIELALNEGFSIREIWHLLYKKKLITVQYRSFLNNVKKHINNKPDENNIEQYKKETNEVIPDKNTDSTNNPPEKKPRFQETPDWDVNSDFGENPILAELKKQGIDLPKK